MNPFVATLQRDLLLVTRRKSEVLTPLFFFSLVASLFPLGLGSDSELLHKIAPGVIWVSALLATMLGLPRLFSADAADGSLEQLVLSPEPLVILVSAKIVAHWLTAGLPLIALAPLLGVQFAMTSEAIALMVVTLALGTPVLSLIGAIGAALTVGVRGAGVLLSLLILPLFIPVLIFSTGAIYAFEGGMGAQGHLSLLAALLIVSVLGAPWVTAAAIKIATA